MCFKNLPIEFDSNGKAKLLDTAGDPYGLKEEPVKQFVGAAVSNAGSAASTTPPRLSAWAKN